MNKLSVLFFFSVAVIVLTTACHRPEKTSTNNFLDTAAMDSSVKPGDNFYLFVNGTWIRQTPIPSSQTGVGGFEDLYNRTQDTLHKLLESLEKEHNPAGSIEQQSGDFYASGMDSLAIEKRGYAPVKPYLLKIDSLKTNKDVMQYVAALQKENRNILFAISVGADFKNSAMNTVFFSQGGLGLPDRDYYFKTDSASRSLVKAYQSYIHKLFGLTGDDSASAAKKMLLLYDLEKQMAFSHKTNVALRDPQSNYHKMPVTEIDRQMPAMSWKTTLDGMQVHADSVIVQQPEFYLKLNELLKTIPIGTWKAYLQFHTLDNNASLLSSDFVKANFEYHKALTGQKEIRPRWFRMIAATDHSLGEAMGQVYVKKYFSEAAKTRMQELVNNLQTAFEERINQLAWMSDSTKSKAKDKLHTFLKKIGYPDKWRDYSKVVVDKATFFENVTASNKNEYLFQVSKIGKPVDKTEWGMTPPTINAYYNPSYNEVVFPAGILQYPFFDMNADDAVNYGAIGMAIGHEMTHGFDDQGAQFDKDGNLKNWWSKGDSVQFVAKTKKVIDQYNAYVSIDTFHVNGALTTGENIADLGGLAIAYDAFKLTKQGQDTLKIAGFTPDQRFFLAFAQVWRSKLKPEYSRLLVNVDPHSPDMFRVIGTLENFTPFYQAFGVKEGDKMYKPENARIKIW